jgi:thiamine-phosphate pyrophosphorylase
MFPAMSPAVSRALEAAQRFAQRAGASEVLPVHLLQGLLLEEEGQAAVLAQAAGLDPHYHQTLALPEDRPTAEELPLQRQTHDCLRQGRLLAIEMFQEDSIVGESLLLALVRGDPDSRAALEGHGLNTTRLEEIVLARRPPPVSLEEPLALADITERVEQARILDAGANRAREALRVIEDYCRFVLDDAFLSGTLKQLRHDLAEALGELTPTLLLEARETQYDVGTELTTDAEQERLSLRDVVQVNLKRLQEALRSLEEYGKLHGPLLGQAVERIRYRSYTLERALLLGAAARKQLAEARLYVLLSGASCTAALDWTIEEAAAGGAHVIQLREKKLTDREYLARARDVRRWTRKAGVLFILNDRPDLARLAEADGVHLGQDDLPVHEARRILGPDALIGVSTHSLEQARQALLDGASYIGVGPTFPSATKPFKDFPGPELVRQVMSETSLPAFVLGGVSLDTIDAAVAAGARRVAVGHAVAAADEPRQAAALLLQALAARSS